MFKKLSLLVLLIVGSTMLGGCTSWFAGTSAGEKAVVAVEPAFADYGRNKEAFGYLADTFRKTNTFTTEESSTLVYTEGALMNEFMYLQEITTVAGSVPYYEYIASYNRIARNVQRMKNILDQHIDAYPQSTRIIYYMSRDNIAYIMKNMGVAIAQAKDGINTDNMSTVIKQFTSLYGAVKPFISTATATAAMI